MAEEPALEPWGRQVARREIAGGVTPPTDPSRCRRRQKNVASPRGVVRVRGTAGTPTVAGEKAVAPASFLNNLASAGRAPYWLLDGDEADRSSRRAEPRC